MVTSGRSWPILKIMSSAWHKVGRSMMLLIVKTMKAHA